MPTRPRLEDYIRDRCRMLEEAHVPEARLNVEWLVAERLAIPRLDLILHSEQILPHDDVIGMDNGVKRLLAGEPIQYILGHVPFHGLTIRVDRRALIPRPETEWLVDQVLSCRPIWTDPEPRLADIGTGSGCIALALAASRTHALVTAVDLSPDAAALAAENRDRLGLRDRVEVRQGDGLDGLFGGYDAVISNPPYIPTAVYRQLDRHVRDQEPRLALDGGADGLDVIRRLANQAMRRLKPGKPLWLEIGYDQGPSVSDLLSGHGYSDVAVRRDWAGRDRFVCAFRPG